MPKTQAKEPTPGTPSFLTGILKRLILLISKELYLDLISLGCILFSSPNYARVITPSSLLVCLENFLFDAPPCQSSRRGHALPQKGGGS